MIFTCELDRVLHFYRFMVAARFWRNVGFFLNRKYIETRILLAADQTSKRHYLVHICVVYIFGVFSYFTVLEMNSITRFLQFIRIIIQALNFTVKVE